MTRKAPIAVFVTLLWAADAAAQGVERLSLREAESRALSNHPQIRAAEYTAQAADAAVWEARSAYFPTVTASLTATQAESGSRIAAGGLNNPIIFDRFAGGISVGQLLTDFGRTHALVDTGILQASATREAITSGRAEVLLQVNRAYFGALRAQAVVRVAEETVSARQLVVDQASAQAASGLKSALDVSFARVSLAEAQILQLQARNDLQAAHTALTAAMGGSENATYELVDEPLPSEPTADGTALVAQASRDRPDIAVQRVAQQAAFRFADAERALRLPSISLVGAMGSAPYRQPGLNGRYSAVGVNLSLPVTTGGLLAARRAEANLRANSEQQRLRDLENLVARDVRTALLDSQASFRRLELAEQLRLHASDAADLAQARYDNGLGSIIELTQAQLDQTRAEIEAASARYDCQVKAAVLRFHTGTLK
jgi:outer membrane protein